ncbi:MAG: peptide chain release factor N(5)-glutamine methyltransferase [Saprospiraceae bacterium]|nr:peptide chain release factor N(5)-glutamine methyltransferase [Saprospiraceae bacterium]
MTSDFARNLLIEQLSPRYGEGEAKAITRIVFEDVFDHGRAFEEARFEAILPRLIAGEPLQYVLGEADFFGLKFKVNPAVLIPRQETEELVAWVLESLKDFSPLSAPAVLDIGLGSGCIGIALKKKRPGIQLFGLEKSPAALDIAFENARRILNIPISQYPSIQLLQGDILNLADWAKFPPLDIVVSNPPYIPHSEKSIVPEHVIDHEPALALFVEDADPLLFYGVIADFSLEKLRPGGMLFFECNEFNSTKVASLLQEKGFSNVQLRKDLSGAERMVKGLNTF